MWVGGCGGSIDSGSENFLKIGKGKLETHLGTLSRVSGSYAPLLLETLRSRDSLLALAEQMLDSPGTLSFVRQAF